MVQIFFNTVQIFNNDLSKIQYNQMQMLNQVGKTKYSAILCVCIFYTIDIIGSWIDYYRMGLKHSVNHRVSANIQTQSVINSSVVILAINWVYALYWNIQYNYYNLLSKLVFMASLMTVWFLLKKNFTVFSNWKLNQQVQIKSSDKVFMLFYYNYQIHWNTFKFDHLVWLITY